MHNIQPFVQKKITFVGSIFRNVIFYKAKPQQRRPEEDTSVSKSSVVQAFLPVLCVVVMKDIWIMSVHEQRKYCSFSDKQLDVFGS